MSDRVPNIPTQKVPILITVFVIILLIGLGLPVVFSLLDSTPPTLTVNGIEKDKRYRGDLTLEIFVTDEDTGVGSLIVQIDDAPPNPLGFGEKGPSLLRLQTAALADGLHTASVTATERITRSSSSGKGSSFVLLRAG